MKSKIKMIKILAIGVGAITVAGLISIVIPATFEGSSIASKYMLTAAMANKSKNSFTKNLEFMAVAGVEYVNGEIVITDNAVTEDSLAPGTSPLQGDGTSWYSETISVAKDTSGGTELLTSKTVKKFTGLPWDPAATGMYYYDAEKAKADVYNWINSNNTNDQYKLETKRTLEVVMDANTVTRQYQAREYVISHGGSTVGAKYLEHYTDRVYPGAIDIDGVATMVIAAMPAVFMRKLCDNFKYDKWREGDGGFDQYNFKGVKLAAVIRDRDTKSEYYIPCTLGDAKGHTFPGGACQTGVKVLNKESDTSSKIKYGDAGLVGDGGDGKEILEDSGIAKAFTTKDMKSIGLPIRTLGSTLEMYFASDNFVKEFNKKYQVVGYVVWPM